MICTYQFAIIATWAQIYAYRERIDAIAGIKEPDFSDLDSHLAKYDLDDLAQSEAKQLFDYIDLMLKKIESEEIPDSKDVNKT